MMIEQLDSERTVPRWGLEEIQTALAEIDWYQFEKFCAALLRAEGYVVERKGGAKPDGGVDLIAEKNGESMLVQCKHWKTWTVKESVIREMLGSMTHFGVQRGAIYTLKGCTGPAAQFAAQHAIELVDGAELASRAMAGLAATDFDEYLRPGTRHCPRCEAPMVLREGNFPSFWGCSRYPACRGKMNHAGAK